MQSSHSILDSFTGTKVLVFGDLMLDEYTIGSIERISPEAPVPVLHQREERRVIGGAGNVALNLSSLKADVRLVGTIGTDDAGQHLTTLFSEHANVHATLVQDHSRPTITKHRFLAGRQQVLRVDKEVTQKVDSIMEEALMAALTTHLSHVEVVVISDYAKGTCTHRIIRHLIDTCLVKGIPVVADTKPKNVSWYQGVTVMTPNQKEVLGMAGMEDVDMAGKHVSSILDATVFVTRADEGIRVFPRGGVDAPINVSGKKVLAYDVTGAGDTVTAITALGVAKKMPYEDIASLANYGGGVVVQKVGTATVSQAELRAAMANTAQHVESVQMVPKLWGYEKWIENNEKYCSKILSLNKGYQCSLHYHKIKDEMFLITKGYVRMEVGSEVHYMYPGQFMRILPNTPHRFRGLEDSELLEISTTHMEEDSYRIEQSQKVEGDLLV